MHSQVRYLAHLKAIHQDNPASGLSQNCSEHVLPSVELLWCKCQVAASIYAGESQDLHLHSMLSPKHPKCCGSRGTVPESKAGDSPPLPLPGAHFGRREQPEYRYRYVTYIGPQSTRTLFANLCEIASGKKDCAVPPCSAFIANTPKKRAKPPYFQPIFPTQHCICYSYAKLSLHSVSPCDASLFSSSWAHFRTS